MSRTTEEYEERLDEVSRGNSVLQEKLQCLTKELQASDLQVSKLLEMLRHCATELDQVAPLIIRHFNASIGSRASNSATIAWELIREINRENKRS